MTGCIVVPTDGSPTSVRAVHSAVVLARARCAPVQLVTVISPGIDPLDAVTDLEALREQVDAPTLAPAVLYGNDVAEALVQHVAASRDAVVCMATHGRSALGAAVLGSTAREVVRISTAPVLLVGPACRHDRVDGAVYAAVDTDSALAGSVVAAAAGWARPAKAPLHLVTAIRTADLRVIGDEHIRSALDGFAADARADGVETGPEVLPSGDDLGRAIADAAEDASVIVVATHARRGVSRLLLGSVAERIVRLARCPVLVVPPSAPAS